jgi:hypothetical protein
VIDGNFYWRSTIDDLIDRLPFPHAVFTLRLSLERCLERDRRRPISYGEEAVRDVYAKVTRFEYGMSIDALSPVSESVRTILAHVPGRP